MIVKSNIRNITAFIFLGLLFLIFLFLDSGEDESSEESEEPPQEEQTVADRLRNDAIEAHRDERTSPRDLMRSTNCTNSSAQCTTNTFCNIAESVFNKIYRMQYGIFYFSCVHFGRSQKPLFQVQQKLLAASPVVWLVVPVM